MTITKHKLLCMFITLQLLGALALIAAFYIELWPLELLVSFTPVATILLFIALAGCSILILAFKHFRKSLPLLAITTVTWVAAVFISFHILTIQKPVELTSASEESITFATLNKLYSNHDTDSFVNYLNQQNIDILTLQEMRPDEVDEVAKRLGFEYTHTTRTFASSGGTSVVLLSRFPFASIETIELATDHPVVRAVIETPDKGNVVVYAVHIPVPASKYLYNKRNIVLGSLAAAIRKEKLPVIIGGDFNTTIFSPAMRSFSGAVKKSMRPIATERIPVCSWFGYGSAMCVRIDHIFAPKKAEITDLTISPDIGADHRAIITTIVLHP